MIEVYAGGERLPDKHVEELVVECADYLRQHMQEGASLGLVEETAYAWFDIIAREAVKRIAWQDERRRWWLKDIRGFIDQMR